MIPSKFNKSFYIFNPIKLILREPNESIELIDL